MEPPYDDDEPELAGYERSERPLRPAYLQTVMRVVVVVGLIGLILPGIVVTLGTANRTAVSTCAAYTAFYAPQAVGFQARFELFAAAGLGWNCYAQTFGGGEIMVKSLGLIPGGARLPKVAVDQS